MFTKPIDEITYQDVESFCQQWSEGVRVEYKRDLNIKKHIPKVVSSFANTYGGIFLIGVEADDTTNMPILPIKGIPKRPNIEEGIQQSAEMSINPPVRPEVTVVKVPDNGSVVVVVSVAEGSLLAPHAIDQSTKAYFRVGSTTQPYKLELANMELIAHMFKRREDSQVVARQVLNRVSERAKHNFRYDVPTLTVMVKPVFPYRPVISTSNIYQLCDEIKLLPLRRVEGGVCHVLPENYLEFNEYGVVYHRISLATRNQQEIKYPVCIEVVNLLIEQVIGFYKECKYLGNIEVTAHLQDVLGIELIDPNNILPGRITDDVEDTRCLNAEVFASKQCLSRDLESEADRKDIVEELMCQLLWEFNIAADQPWIKERVRERIK